MVSLYILVIITVMSIIGPYIDGKDFSEQHKGMSDLVPSAKFWFGTDQLGRDLFSRLWMGGRVSIIIGFIGTILDIVVGCLYGGVAGYFGGLTDEIMMRIVEILSSIPYLIIVILLSVVLGKGIIPLIIAMTITGWVGLARIIRGQIMQLKESEYVLAAQALGADSGRIITRHLLPNTIGIIIINAAMDVPGFIFGEAFLSFIGLGIQPPDTSWGALISYGQQSFEFYPHELLFPAIVMSLYMLSFNLFGDGLRDALDPKLRQ
jgi:oligopeptide transport system permease protein